MKMLILILFITISSHFILGMDKDIMSIQVKLEPKETLRKNLLALNYDHFLPLAEELGDKKHYPLNILMAVETSLHNLINSKNPRIPLLQQKTIESLLNETLLSSDAEKEKKDLALLKDIQKNIVLRDEIIDLLRKKLIHILLPDHINLQQHFNQELSSEKFHEKYRPSIDSVTGDVIDWELKHDGIRISENLMGYCSDDGTWTGCLFLPAGIATAPSLVSGMHYKPYKENSDFYSDQEPQQQGLLTEEIDNSPLLDKLEISDNKK